MLDMVVGNVVEVVEQEVIVIEEDIVQVSIIVSFYEIFTIM